VAYKLIDDQITEYGGSYQGKAEACLYTFRAPPTWLPGSGWSAQQFLNRQANEIAGQGCHLLRQRVWVDKHSLYADYRVEATATASPIAWGIIIPVILAIVIGIITWKILSVAQNIDWGGFGTTIKWGMIGIIALIAIPVIISAVRARRE